jgi:hypothetical protein
MSLFKADDLKDELLPVDELVSSKVEEVGRVGHWGLGRVHDTLTEVMGDMKTDLHYVSHGHWSLHNLLEYILPKVGKADVYIATWSLGEDATRCILNLVDAGWIHRIYAVLDYRAKNRHEAAFYLAQGHFAKIHTTACHAKVTVIVAEGHTLTINGSANYTNNPRIESGVISVSEKVAGFHKKWILDVIDKVSVFE